MSSSTPVLELSEPPRIVQSGLCIHGVRHSERFRLQDAWGLHAYYYKGALRMNAIRHEFYSGQASLTPPRHEIEWFFPPHAPHYYVHFALPEGSDDSALRRQVILSPGPRFESFTRRLRTLLALVRDHPHQARVHLWSLLYDLICPPAHTHPERHAPPALQVALNIMHNKLSERLTADSIARQVGVSPGHLNRVFRSHMKETPHRYLQALRLDRASQLLRESAMPIKSVAASTGFNDLSHFNKFIRKALGQAPRKIRQEAGTVDYCT